MTATERTTTPMYLKVLRAKIHRPTVTQSEVDYVGSITIDSELLDAAGIVPGECVLVGDLNGGARFETYAMAGEAGSGTVCVNGAAARLVEVGDRIIVMAFAYAEPEEARRIRPRVVLVNEENQVERTL